MICLEVTAYQHSVIFNVENLRHNYPEGMKL